VNTTDTNDLNADPGENLRKMAGNENIFRTPENYFEKLPVQISDAIHSHPAHNVGVFKPAYLVYTMLFIFTVLAGTWYLSRNRESEKQLSAITYIDFSESEMITSIDENILIEELTALNSTSQSTNANSELQEYLIENNLDVTILTNEL
jgi:hypothetical protein